MDAPEGIYLKSCNSSRFELIHDLRRGLSSQLYQVSEVAVEMTLET
jgi:hypothetical protein